MKVTSQFSIDNERLTKLFSADALPSLIANKKQVLLVFSNISSQLPVGGFYEIYLDSPDVEKLNIESPHYVGNLTTFGSDQLSRDTMNAAGKHEAMEGLNVAIDITERLKDLSARSRIKKNAFEITLVRAGVEDEKGTVAAFDSKSQLEIGSIDVQIIGANGIEK